MMPYSKPKVNSVQEACGKCFAVLLSKFEILQTTHTHKKKGLKIGLKIGRYRKNMTVKIFLDQKKIHNIKVSKLQKDFLSCAVQCAVL